MGRVWKVLVVVAVLVAGNLVFSSASAGGGGGHDGGTTIWLKAVNVDEAEVDADGSGGPSLGDQVVFTDNLYLRRQKVGTLDGFCVLQRLDPTILQCLLTASVNGAGQIAHQGSIRLTPEGELPRRFVLPITGGSGDFVGAEGQTKVIPRTETVVMLKVMLED